MTLILQIRLPLSFKNQQITIQMQTEYATVALKLVANSDFVHVLKRAVVLL